MKVSRKQAQLNRDRVVETAAKLFRERGFDGIGISDLMKEVGLTHGGFYAQFPSKEHLMSEAVAKAAEEREQVLQQQLQGDPKTGLAGFAERYLSHTHRDNPGLGCFVATLGIDSARQGPLVRDAFTRSIQSALELLSGAENGKSDEERRKRAIVDYATLIGGMVMARAVSDPSLSDEILDTLKSEVAVRSRPARRRTAGRGLAPNSK